MGGNFFDSFNLVKRCQKYQLPLWQCPQFLFMILGLVVIGSSLAIYFIGTQFSESPDIVALIILAVSAFLMAVGFIITQSFEKLADLARMKSEFISIVSHQLRSPLANLKWTIDLLMSGRIEAITEKQIDYFQVLRENSQRMEGLISDLLAVSRLESNEMTVKTEIISFESLGNLIKGVILRFEPLAKASNVEIKLSMLGQTSMVSIDRSQIEQIIENLLNNAICYGRIGGKGLAEISLKEAGERLYFEFKDNGIGIREEDQKYIFQKFFRGENAFRHQVQGSGLGLYIAKAMVEKHGGKIGFSSKEGEGSTFWFTIPLRKR